MFYQQKQEQRLSFTASFVTSDIRLLWYEYFVNVSYIFIARILLTGAFKNGNLQDYYISIVLLPTCNLRFPLNLKNGI